MIKLTSSLACACLLTVAACAPTGDAPADDITWGGAPALDSGSYQMRDVAAFGLTGAELLPEAAWKIQAELGGNAPREGNSTEMTSVYDRPPRGAVVVLLDNLQDDSVQAEQHVVEFDLRPDAQVEGRVFAMPTGYGVRHKCARGANAGVWTTDLCI